MDRALLDLSPDRAATLLDAALERQHADRLFGAADHFLAKLPAEGSGLGRLLLGELARLAARVEALEQAAAAAALAREERLRIDPLRAIPAERVAAAQSPAPVAETRPVTLDPGDPDFTGFGWWEAERAASGSLRWSGAARCATLLLPALGGGEMVLNLCLRMPFGLPFDIAEHDWFLDGMPLSFATTSSDGVVGVFEARATLPPMPVGARVALLLHGRQSEDPAPGPMRDPRRMGLGLIWARLERA
jgi:hypothetical protein